ncbi:hypothetical protein LY78DRAFT_229931 [Colletotrichum sublineola]|nr:hypothetical protein LY78DRAFT_229931 [Colletotrichum sublineola]
MGRRWFIEAIAKRFLGKSERLLGIAASLMTFGNGVPRSVGCQPPFLCRFKASTQQRNDALRRRYHGTPQPGQNCGWPSSPPRNGDDERRAAESSGPMTRRGHTSRHVTPHGLERK